MPTWRKYHRAARALSPAEAEGARQAYEFGESRARIARRLGVSESTVYRAVAASRPERRRRRAA